MFDFLGMSYTEAVINGLMLGLFIAISVGPTLFAVIKYSIHHSYRAGLAFVIGVSFSDIVYVAIANIATKWLDFLQDHQREVGYIGSVLFIIMGLYGLIKKYKPQRPLRSSEPIQISSSAYLGIAFSGFLMNALNPGVIIYWIGAATLVSSEASIIKIIVFGTCLSLVLGVDLLKVFLADKIRKKLTLRNIMYLNKASAIIILSLGILLFLKTLFNVSIGGH